MAWESGQEQRPRSRTRQHRGLGFRLVYILYNVPQACHVVSNQSNQSKPSPPISRPLNAHHNAVTRKGIPAASTSAEEARTAPDSPAMSCIGIDIGQQNAGALLLRLRLDVAASGAGLVASRTEPRCRQAPEAKSAVSLPSC